MSIKIDANKCTGCKICMRACPFNAIRMENKKAKILENCTLCGICANSCKFEAIKIEKAVEFASSFSDYKGIWILAEHKNNKIEPITLELLGIARKLADDLNVAVSAIVIGDHIEGWAPELIAYGADEVYMIEDQILINYNEERYYSIITQLIEERKPEILLIGATSYGRSLAPRLSSRFNTGLTADCTALEIDPIKKILIQTRPAFGGNLMASIICPNHRPQMATIRPRVMKAMVPDYSRAGKIIRPVVDMPKQTNVKILDFLDNSEGDLNIIGADIILSAGRGLGNPSNLAPLKKLADILGASIGASRAIVDAGWIDQYHQIGQTGRTVAPKIYFAFGISGAIQHIAGMSSSDVIIAINKDSEAPIFKIADYGIVGDAVEIIYALIEYFVENK